jgi:hypothetical protein
VGMSRSRRTVSRTCNSVQLGWSTSMFTRLMLSVLFGGHIEPDVSDASAVPDAMYLAAHTPDILRMEDFG